MPAYAPSPTAVRPSPVALLQATSPTARLQGRSLVIPLLARSLVRRYGRSGDAPREPRGGGTARVERERQASRCGSRTRPRGVNPYREQLQDALQCRLFTDAARSGAHTHCSHLFGQFPVGGTTRDVVVVAPNSSRGMNGPLALPARCLACRIDGS